jgi:hypothetical protein
VRLSDTPFGERPFRVHIDPVDDGAEAVNGVAHRVRRELLRNMGLSGFTETVTRRLDGEECLRDGTTGRSQ